MGEIADMMLDGTLCQGCGVYIGECGGYPVSCDGCADENDSEQQQRKRGVRDKCQHCERWIAPSGMQQHMEAKHSEIVHGDDDG